MQDLSNRKTTTEGDSDLKSIQLHKQNEADADQVNSTNISSSDSRP